MERWIAELWAQEWFRLITAVTATVAATTAVIGTFIKWREWRASRTRPAPIFEAHGSWIDVWPGWFAINVVVRNSGPASIRLAGTSPGRFRLHRVVPFHSVATVNGYGGFDLPSDPPERPDPIHLLNMTVHPDPDRPGVLTVLVGPRRAGGIAPGHFLLLWHWTDQADQMRQKIVVI